MIERGGLKGGETLLVLGAGSGAGLAAVEIGKILGARVVAAASSQDKLDLAKRVVSVPKAEIDKRDAEWKRQRRADKKSK